MTPSEIRTKLRKARQTLSLETQQSNSNQAFQAFKEHIQKHYLCSSKIALFLSQDGELNTQQCIHYLWHETEHSVYLPVLETRNELHMAFAQFRPNSTMVKNQFGIEEPKEAYEFHLTGEQMDLVVMPLVGFDKDGNRLGMGGGFYDRTFAFKLEKDILKPELIGWAHSCQQVERLPKEPWDVPLNGVITEKGFTHLR